MFPSGKYGGDRWSIFLPVVLDKVALGKVEESEFASFRSKNDKAQHGSQSLEEPTN